MFQTLGGCKLDYKQKIIEMLDMADQRCLKLIYHHVRSLLGLK